MENNAPNSCPLHSTLCTKICNTCDAVLCPLCQHNRKHQISSILEYTTYNINTLPLPYDYKILSYDIEIALKDSWNLLNSECEEMKVLKENIRNCEKQRDSATEAANNDIILVEKARMFLYDVFSMASTNTLKQYCSDFIGQSDIEDNIIEEVNSAETMLKTLSSKLEKVKQRLTKLVNNYNQLQSAKESILGKPSDTNQHFSLVFLMKTKALQIPHNINTTVNDYRSFSRPELIFDIDSVMKSDLVDVGYGVKVTPPIPVFNTLRTEGEFFHSSLSHTGVLSICTFLEKNIVQLTDLVKGNQVAIDVEGWTSIGFYDDSAIVLTMGYPLREATVESLFKTQDTSVLNDVGTVKKVSCYADTSVLHLRRKLYYRSRHFASYEYNVDKKTNRVFKNGKKVFSFASLTGINVGVRGVFLEDEGESGTYCINNDCSIVKLYKFKQDGLTTVFPSSSDPKDLRKAVLKYGDTLFTSNGDRISFKGILDFESFYSVIRLYMDVFLVFDYKIKKMELGELRDKLRSATEQLRRKEVTPNRKLNEEADEYLNNAKIKSNSYSEIPQFYPTVAHRFANNLATFVKEHMRAARLARFQDLTPENNLIQRLFTLVDTKGIQPNNVPPGGPDEVPTKTLSYARYKQVVTELSKEFPTCADTFHSILSPSNFALLPPVPPSMAIVQPSVFASDILHMFLRQFSIINMAKKLSLFDGNADGYIDEEELSAFVDAQLPIVPALVPGLKPLEPFHACVVKKGLWFLCNQEGRQFISVSDMASSEAFGLFISTFEECPPGAMRRGAPGCVEPSPNAMKVVSQMLVGMGGGVDNGGNMMGVGELSVDDVQRLYYPPPTNWFSMANTIELYTRFAELDERELGFLEPENLRGYTGVLTNPGGNSDFFCGGLTEIAVERILEHLQTYGENRKIDFKVFVEISLAFRWPKKPLAKRFFFGLVDLFGHGCLTRFSLRPFVRETMERLKDEFTDGPPDPEDVIDQVFDDMEPHGGSEGLRISKMMNQEMENGSGFNNGSQTFGPSGKRRSFDITKLIKSFPSIPYLRVKDIQSSCHGELLGFSCTDPSSFLEFDQQEQSMADNQNDSMQFHVSQNASYLSNSYQEPPRIVHEV